MSKTPQFKIGFEVELNVAPSYCTGSEMKPGNLYRSITPAEVLFWQGIKELPGLSAVEEGYDCHNDPNMRPAEIRTPPQRLEEGIASFFELIKYLAGFPEKDVYSTSRCGLHINVSEPEMMKDRITSLRFFNHIIQHYPEWAVMERFGREINPTCQPWFSRGIPTAERVAAHHPYWSNSTSTRRMYASQPDIGLSIANKDLSNPPSNRIEFRGHGNAGYHKKTDDLRFAIDKIVESCTTAFNYTFSDTRDEQHLIAYNW